MRLICSILKGGNIMQAWKNLQLTSKETKAKTVMTEKESEMIAPAMGNRLLQPKMILLRIE
jgi:hypothetical protein